MAPGGRICPRHSFAAMSTWISIGDAADVARRWFVRHVVAESHIHVNMAENDTDDDIIRELLAIEGWMILREALLIFVEHKRYGAILGFCTALFPSDTRVIGFVFEEIFTRVTPTVDFYRMLLNSPEVILSIAIRACFDTQNENTIRRFMTHARSLLEITDGAEQLTAIQFSILTSVIRARRHPSKEYSSIEYSRVLKCFPRGDFCAGCYEGPRLDPLSEPVTSATTLLHKAVDSINLDIIRHTRDHIGPAANITRDHAGRTPLEHYLHLVESGHRPSWGYADSKIKSILTNND